MKTNATLNNATPPDIRTCPAEFKAASGEVLKNVVPLMTLHGIKSIAADITQVGAQAVIKHSYTVFETIKPPEPFDIIQAAAAEALVKYVILFGIHSIDIEVSADELKVLAAGYDQLRAEARNALNAPKATPTDDPDKSPLALPRELDNV